MVSVKPSPSDFSALNAQKEATRALVLNLAAESSLLWDDGHKCLRFHWLESVGTTAETFQFLHAKGCLTPTAKFIGVDTDKDVLAQAATFMEPGLSIPVHRDIGAMLSDMSNKHPSNSDLLRVGVAVVDLSLQLSNPKWQTLMKTAIKAGKRQCDRIGEFLLVFNPTNQNDRGDTQKFWDVLKKSGLRGDPNPIAYPCKGAGGFMYFTPISFGFETGASWLP